MFHRTASILVNHPGARQPPRRGSKTEIIPVYEEPRPLSPLARGPYNWVGESSTQSITLCGVEGENIGTGQIPCPDCVKVGDALNVCGLGPESLREAAASALERRRTATGCPSVIRHAPSDRPFRAESSDGEVRSGGSSAGCAGSGES